MKDEFGREIHRPRVHYIYSKQRDDNVVLPFDRIHVWNCSGFLNESYGIVEYNNNKLRYDVRKFVTTTLRNVVDECVPYDTEILFADGWHKNYHLLKLNTNLEWCSFIYILLTHEDDDVNCVALARNDGDTSSFVIKRHGRTTSPFSMRDNSDNYFSIILNIPKECVFNTQELCGVLLHEIQHAFRMFRFNFNNNSVNKDILYFQQKAIDDVEFMKTVYGTMKDEIDIIDLCETLDCYHMFLIIREFSYYLNMSEIEARRATFASECLENPFQNIICSSPSYYIYYKIYKTLRYMQRYCRDDEKDKFAQTYIVEIEPLYFGQYKHLLRHNGVYDSVSFDKLMDFYRERIDRYFLKRCDKIFTDIRHEN